MWWFALSSIHVAIILTSFSILTFIVAHLRKKALQKENIKLVVQIDLAFLTGLFVGSFSALVLVRESVGPATSHLSIYLVHFTPIALFHAVVFAILALQLAQLALIFKLTLVNDTSLTKLTLAYRCLVCLTATMVGHFISENLTSSCNQGPLCTYLTHDQGSML